MSSTDSRYQCVTMNVESGSLAIISDRENQAAWLQSSAYVPVER